MTTLIKRDNLTPIKVSYIVIDRKTMVRANNTVYKSRAAADKAVDRLDNEFGGYRYFVKAL